MPGQAPNGNESVGWTVADPVTESRPQHELEPFGQEIGGPVPETDDDPYANSAPFSPAEEPQWMCGLYDQSHSADRFRFLEQCGGKVRLCGGDAIERSKGCPV